MGATPRSPPAPQPLESTTFAQLVIPSGFRPARFGVQC